MNRDLKDTFLILKDKKLYKEEILKRYGNVLNGIEDLYGDGYDDLSTLFYLLNRRYLHWLDNNPDVAIKEKEIEFRRKFYEILKVVGPKMLGCTQVMENRRFLDDPTSTESDDEIKLPDKPVIFAANHGFRDDVLATVLAANRHAYLYCGSLPMFYNTVEGLATIFVGQVMANRKSKESRKFSIDKSIRVMDLGADMILFPEGGWNKTSEKFVLDLWKGIYLLSTKKQCDVVPIIHYVRDMEVVDKKNIIHTVVDNPIPLYEMSQKEALEYLRNVLASWQYKMAEQYGKTTRKEEMIGYETSDLKWKYCVEKRMKGVSRYDSQIEKQSDYRPKEIVRPEDAFRAISNIQNITSENAKMVLESKKLVKTRENSDFQRLY